MKWSTAGYIWTFCAAGWTVIAFLSQLPEAWITAAGCGLMSGACVWISNDE